MNLHYNLSAAIATLQALTTNRRDRLDRSVRGAATRNADRMRALLKTMKALRLPSATGDELPIGFVVQ